MVHRGAKALGLRLALSLALAWLVGCQPKQPSGSDAGVAAATDAGPKTKKGDSPLTAEELKPVFTTSQKPGVIPDELLVTFAKPVVSEYRANAPGISATAITVDPPIEGTVSFKAPNVVAFKPKNPLTPGTAYTLKLEAVETTDFLLKPEQPWTHTFTTPPFAAVALETRKSEFPAHKVTLLVTYASAIQAHELARFATFKVEDQVVATPVFKPGEQPNTAEVVLESPALAPYKNVVVELAPGMPSVGGLTAPAGKLSLILKEGPPVKILKVARREGPTGFYIDVICNDEGGGEPRYYWDDSDYDSYQVSSRCLLTPDSAKGHVHLTPAIPFEVSQFSGGFRIQAPFNRGEYKLVIDAAARTVDGGYLEKGQETTITIPARSPKVRFVSQGRYLPKSAWKSLAIKHLNVDSLSVEVRHIPKRNLVFWMSDNSEGADPRNSELVTTTSLPVRGEADKESTSWVNLGDLVPNPQPGVYELTLSSGGARDARRLLLTDMHLVVKRAATAPEEAERPEFLVFALDTHTNRPLSGVEVELIRPSGQRVSACRTAGAAGCSVRRPEGDPDPTAPFALIATQGRDFTYLKFSELQTELGDDPVYGLPYLAERPYDSAVYTDRGVYRPGETAHVVALIRGTDHRAPAAGLPVTFELVDPRENVARRLQTQTNAVGLAAFDPAFANYAPTGRYTARVMVGERAIGNTTFNVEAFVPERMKVTATATPTEMLTSQQASVLVAARYLFGGSAAGSEATLTCQLIPSSFTPPGATGFTFGLADGSATPSAIDLGTVTGNLTADGTLTMACPALEGNAQFPVAGKVVADVAVFESGSGRSTKGRASTRVHPAAHYLGLKTNAKRATPGEAFDVEGVVVDWQGKPFSALTQVEVEFVRLEGQYGYYYDQESDSQSWRRNLRPEVEGKQTVPVKDGRFTLSARPVAASDGYVVRVKAGTAQSELRLAGTYEDWDWNEYPYESFSSRTPRPTRPTALRLTLPDQAKVGEPLEIAFEAPFKGRALLTVETHQVIEARWIEVNAGRNAQTLTLKDFAPNVYVSVFVLKDPHLESREAFLPDRAFGARSLKIEPSAFVREVKLTAPTEVKPHEFLEIGVDLGPLDEPAFVTVAAVDQGILSLTGFTPPDPADQLFARRALGVTTFDTIGWALKLPKGGPQGASGGDADGGDGEVRPIKPVALWSGLVAVPTTGKATVRFEVPQYRGSLKVMAVAATAGRVGHADTEVTVRDPLVVQTTLPRFLVKGDRFQIPVFVTNLSGAKRQITVKLKARPLAVAGLALEPDAPAPLTVEGQSEKVITLENEKSETVVFLAEAKLQVGAAELEVEARAGEIYSYEKLEVPFNPAGARARKVERLPLMPGQSVDLAAKLQGWVPTSERTTLWVTTVPQADRFDHLRYLVQYPHGCIEQTTSATRPLLFVSSFLESVAPDVVSQAGGVEKMVRYGIDRVLSMQTPSGGFGYWPGSSEPHRFGTAYATHMLLEARDQGYEIPASRLDDVLTWIEGAVDDSENQDAKAYLHYVLAKAGRARKAQLLELAEGFGTDPKGQDAEDAYLVKAALYAAGDRRYEADLKKLDTSALAPERETGGSFYSDQRRRAFALALFFDLFGNDPAGKPLFEQVATTLSSVKSGDYTTQELAWSVTALGKWVQGSAKGMLPPTLAAGGKAIASLPSKDKLGVAWLIPRASEKPGLTLAVPFQNTPNLSLVIASEGVRAGDELKGGGEGLEVTREWLTLAGKPIDPTKIRLGDVIFTRVTVINKTKERVENLALVDRFPAGWEVENARLGRSTRPDWVVEDEQWGLDHLDIRDDRVVAFGSLDEEKSFEVTYALRAVSAGRFTAPPVELEAMYDPDLWARELGEAVEIHGGWAPFVD